MRILIIISTCVLLLFNGVGAIYGGWNLMFYPDGSSLDMSLDYLQYSPFSSYLVPGIILFVTNGLGSILTLILTIFRVRNYSWFVLGQGVVLSGWILEEILMLKEVVMLHIVMGATGLLLVLMGIMLGKVGERKPQVGQA